MPAPAPEPQALSPDPQLAQALAGWRARLAAAGIDCRAVAWRGASGALVPFGDTQTELEAPWAELSARINADQPVALQRIGTLADAPVLLAASVGGSQPGIVGALLGPPHSERTVQSVLLSLGGLQWSLGAAALAQDRHAARLLELLAHVASQPAARTAAQDWINRVAAWLRADLAADVAATNPPQPDADQPAGPPFTLLLFQVRGDQPRWWVTADAAWSEKASPGLQAASEAAMQALVESRAVRAGVHHALPLLDQGEVVAVLVARSEAPLPPAALQLLQASAAIGEPFLRRWRDAERGLWRHLADAIALAWRRLRRPGHLTWKVGAVGVLALLAVLLLWPVADRVTAAALIEGRTRQLVSTPFDGFVAAALVRPGDRVSLGQPLLRLDDRDWRLDLARWSSEREQAAAKLRQALAERDPPAVQLASAELRQAQAQLALAQAKVERAELRAPMDGLVVTGDWSQQTGAPVEAGKQLFEIASADAYRVVLHVADRDIARLAVGQSGHMRLAGQPQQTYEFSVSRITAVASVHESVNGFRVEAEWRDGAVPALTPGMQGVGKVEVGRTNLLGAWTRPSLDWLRLKLWAWW